MGASDRRPPPVSVRPAHHGPPTRPGYRQAPRKARALSLKHPFFHWPLEFPDVWERGGFDVVLGNPPWEEEEFFAARDREIAHAPNKSARGRLIQALVESNPMLSQEFGEAKHESEAESKFIRGSGRFKLCGRGDVNTYSIFAETNRNLLNDHGRAGCIVQSGIATDDTTRFFFADLTQKGSLISLYDFVNTEGIFPGIHRTHPHFCLLTMRSWSSGEGADFSFWNTNVACLNDMNRHYTLTAKDMALLNPNTRTCPIFRSRRDAELTKAIYQRVPVLIEDGPPERNPWDIRFMAIFHMSNDSHLFRTRAQLEAEGLRLEGNVFLPPSGSDATSDGVARPSMAVRLSRYLPLYEAKMVHQFDHPWATYIGADTRDMTLPEKQGPHSVALPRYWVPETEVAARLKGRWSTVIAGILPRGAVGHTMPLVLLPPEMGCLAPLLAANLSAFGFDFCARQKVGGTHLTYGYLSQLPVLAPATYDQPALWSRFETLETWISTRVLELVYTAWDMQPFARDMGYHGPPFRWDVERRFVLRCELDAAFFHLYGIARDDVDYVMDTFPIVKRKDEAKWGEYRTKRVILEMYDAIQRAMESGVPYGETAIAARR
ncbi:MAG: Eco57I restriction-modification methylase domain-containing protein [Chloroflexota bacterium]